jgi:hypothetical protein
MSRASLTDDHLQRLALVLIHERPVPQRPQFEFEVLADLREFEEALSVMDRPLLQSFVDLGHLPSTLAKVVPFSSFASFPVKFCQRRMITSA